MGREVRLMHSLLKNTKVSAFENGIEILFADPFSYTMMENGKRTKDLEAILKARYGKDIRVKIRLLKKNESAPKVVPGNRIPGIDMDITDEEGD